MTTAELEALPIQPGLFDPRTPWGEGPLWFAEDDCALITDSLNQPFVTGTSRETGAKMRMRLGTVVP